MSVVRLVVHANPDGRETPALLLAALRDIDPVVELVYFGARDWRLGAVAPLESPAHEARAKKGDLMLRQFRDIAASGITINPKNYLLALLAKQGFAQIAKYTDHGDVAGAVTDEAGNVTSILAHFRNIQAQWLSDGGEAALRRTLAIAAGEPERHAGNARLADYLAADARDHYAREVKGRVTFGPGGMTGGRGRILAPGAYSPTGPIVTGEQVMADLEQIMAELA